MVLKILMSLSGLFCLSACSGGGAGGGLSSVPVKGVDLSGIYSLAGVECYSQSTYQMTEYASFLGYTSVLTISGNSISSVSQTASCAAETNGRVVFNSDNTAEIGDMSYSSVSSGACTFSLNLSNTPTNTITPKALSTTVSRGQVEPGKTTNWVRNNSTESIGILSVYKAANPSDVCLLIYFKN